MYIRSLNKQFCLAWFLISLLLIGCRDQVHDEFPDITPEPVMNCFLAADSLIRVHVSLAGKLDTKAPTVVNNAIVTCSINDSVTEVLIPAGNGFYSGKTIVKAGNVYRFNVTVPGFAEMTASDTVPEKSLLRSIEHINLAGIDEEGNSFPAVRITFPVNPIMVHYYQVTIRYDNYGRLEYRSN
jgi:hypothetical protein